MGPRIAPEFVHPYMVFSTLHHKNIYIINTTDQKHLNIFSFMHSNFYNEDVKKCLKETNFTTTHRNLHQLCITLFGKQFISPLSSQKKTEKKFFPNTDCAKLSNTDDTVVHKLYGVL